MATRVDKKLPHLILIFPLFLSMILPPAAPVLASGRAQAGPLTYLEQFNSDVFAGGGWIRTDSSVWVDTANGWLQISPDGGADDAAERAMNAAWPVTIETRLRLVSGGGDYRLPWLKVFYGPASPAYIGVTYNSSNSYGWNLNGFTGSHVKAPPSANTWLTLRIVLAEAGGELWVKYDNETEFTRVAVNTWHIPLPMIGIRLEQPLDSVVTVDYLDLQGQAAPGPFEKLSPADADDSRLASTLLSWSASPEAESYEYCYDTVDDAACSTAWVDAGSNTRVEITNLDPWTVYYWQVRARLGSESAPADFGSWGSFNWGYAELFGTDVFAAGSWSRTDTSVTMDGVNGWLHIGSDGQADDYAEKQVAFAYPLTLETRLRSAGGLDYRLPWLHLVYGPAPEQKIAISYNTTPAYGWALGTFTGVHTKAPPADNTWVTLRVAVRADGADLSARFDGETGFTHVVSQNWPAKSEITAIRIYQPLDAGVDVDFLRLMGAGVPYDLGYCGLVNAARDSSGEDAWYFQGEQGDIVSIAAAGEDSFLLGRVSLRAQDGSTLACQVPEAGNIAGVGGYVLPSAGRYTAVVDGRVNEAFPEGEYTLVLLRSREYQAAAVGCLQPDSLTAVQEGFWEEMTAQNLGVVFGKYLEEVTTALIANWTSLVLDVIGSLLQGGSPPTEIVLNLGGMDPFSKEYVVSDAIRVEAGQAVLPEVVIGRGASFTDTPLSLDVVKTSEPGSPPVLSQVLLTAQEWETLLSSSMPQFVLTPKAPLSLEDAGTYQVTISGLDTDARDTAVVTVYEPTTTTITATEPNPSVPLQPVLVRVTVSSGAGTPAGQVQIQGADADCSLTLEDGSGSCTVVFTSAGSSRLLTAVYPGSGWHAPSTGTAVHEVGAVPRLTWTSEAARDGWILESTEFSRRGGSLNADSGSLFAGDDAGDRQYVGVLHFNTASLPDTAVITKVTLRLRKQGVAGTDPFNTHGNLLVDIRTGAFGGSGALQLGDFQAAASKSAVGGIPGTPLNGWYAKTWLSGIFPYINKAGVTQFRLRFAKDDNDDLGADYLKFYSGNAVNAAYRPQLVIEYTLP